MHPLVLELLPAVRQGHCCSQLLMTLALQSRGEDNPGLMRALRGLCHGIGQSNGPCGLLSGGAAVLAWLSGNDGDAPHPMLEPMLNEYAQWFYERTQSYGGYVCESIMHGLGVRAQDNATGGADMSVCANLLAECWEKIMELYDSYELDSVRS